MFIVENWFREYFVWNFTKLGIKKKKRNYKQLPIRGTPKDGERRKKNMCRGKIPLMNIWLTKMGSLSAMLFRLRDGFLSSIGQQNISVIYEHHSIWLHPQDAALYFNTNTWMNTAGSPLFVNRSTFFIKVPPTPNESESYSRRKTI